MLKELENIIVSLGENLGEKNYHLEVIEELAIDYLEKQKIIEKDYKLLIEFSKKNLKFLKRKEKEDLEKIQIKVEKELEEYKTKLIDLIKKLCK